MAYPCGQISPELCTNRKVQRLLTLPGGREALGLWTMADSWCNSELTDGFVPSYMVARLGWKPRFAELLVAVGLWVRAEAGYQFHDWEDFNELKTAVLKARAKWNAKNNRVRGTKRNEKALLRHLTPGVTSGVTPGETLGVTRPLGIDVDLDLLSHPHTPTAGWTAHDQHVAFVAAFEASQRTTPSMGGKTVASFHGTVMRTAELQKRDPRELFTEKLAQWLACPLRDVERKAPYACFQQSWGDLTSVGEKAPPAGSQAPQRPFRGRVAPAPATTGKDFEDADDIETQMARWKNGK